MAIHITEAAAQADFPALLARVRAGEEIIIESENKPIAILRPPDARGRTISESLALAEAGAKRLGYVPLMDDDYAADMRDIIANRKPRDLSAWD